jgi:thioredoxin 1
VFTCFAAVATVVGVSKYWMPRDLVPWRTDFPAARAEAAAAGKPMLLYFTAEWCGPCQVMRRNVFPEKTVASAMELYVPVKIDVDRTPDIARKYGIESLPQFVHVNQRGEVVRSKTGLMESAEMIEWLNAAEPGDSSISNVNYRVFDPIGVSTFKLPRLTVNGTVSIGVSGHRAANSS